MENQFKFSPEASSIEQIPEATAAPAAVQPLPPQEPKNVSSAREQKKGKYGALLTVTIIAVAFSLLMSAFALWVAISGNGMTPGLGNGTGTGQDHQIPQSSTPSYNYDENVTEQDALTPQQIIQKLSPSVVTVLVEGYDDNGQPASGFGTGIVYTDNGYILTNAHVVENTTAVTVRDWQETEYTATVIGSDSASDVAVIKIEAAGLTPAQFGTSASVVPGDSVIAIGTPYADNLSLTSTSGMVSALRDNMSFPELGYTLDLIQHDAAINSGNSGGPLVNVYGQVIGINSIKISGTYENLGFALQIDAVLPLAQEIMNTGKVSRPGIGITGTTYETADMRGAYVYSVVPNGPAANAGLRKNDIIIKADDTEISSIEDLKDFLGEKKVGDTVTITYVRNNTVRTTELVIGELN